MCCVLLFIFLKSLVKNQQARNYVRLGGLRLLADCASGGVARLQVPPGHSEHWHRATCVLGKFCGDHESLLVDCCCC